MTTETKVEAVAWAVVVNGKPDFADIRKWECEREAAIFGDVAGTISIEPLYPASAITALVGEVSRLRAIEEAARTYYREYCQDEAGDELLNDGRGMWTGATAKQINDAAALRDALTKESP